MEIIKDYEYDSEINIFLMIDRATNLLFIDNHPNNQEQIKTNTSIKHDPVEEDFEEDEDAWKTYVKFVMLESSCGEGNYLCQRYEEKTNELIQVEERCGFVDKRLYKIFQKATNDTWFPWVKKSIQSVYGYDSSGINVMNTRKKILDTFIDYCRHYKNVMPGRNEISQIALILSYNIWQMDPTTCKVIDEPEAPFAVTCDWKTNKIKPCLFFFPQN